MTDPHGHLNESQVLFAEARNWKAYWQSFLAPLLRGRVLEAGAGIGANTLTLAPSPGVASWVCLEPCWALAFKARAAIPHPYGVVCGTTAALKPQPAFNAVLYIDVLEHIEEDALELRQAARLLRTGGKLIVLVPAHGWLYSPFDAALGHFRRYNRGSLTALTPPGMQLERCFYLDSAGLLANAANRLLLRQRLPRPSQLRLWDRTLIPLSRRLDKLLGHRLGKTLLAIWSAQPDAGQPV